MKKNDIEVGKTYAIKVSEKIQPVQIIAVSPHGGWNGRNRHTGRDVRVKTAAKCRYEVILRDRNWVRKDLQEAADSAVKRTQRTSAERETWSFQCPYNGIPMRAKFEGVTLSVKVDVYDYDSEYDEDAISEAEGWAQELNGFAFQNLQDARSALRKAGADIGEKIA